MIPLFPSINEGPFHALIDTIPSMIWVADPAGKRTFFNKKWLDFTGRSLAQELGDGWVEGIHLNDSVHYNDIYRQAFARQQAFEIDFRLRKKTGEYCWMMDRGAPHFAATGELLGYTGSCIDITDRKQVEQQLATQQAVTRVLATATTLEAAMGELLPALAFHLEAEFCIFWQPDAAHQQLICSASHATATIIEPQAAWDQATPPTDILRQPQPLNIGAGDSLARRVWQTKQASWVTDLTQEANFSGVNAGRDAGLVVLGLRTDFAFPILGGDLCIGVLEWFSRQRLTPDQSSLIEMLMTIGRMIGQFIQRKQAEEALRVREERFRIVSELSSDLAYELRLEADDKISFEWVAGALEQITGYTLTEFEQIDGWRSTIHPDDHAVIEERQKILRAGQTDDRIYRIITKSGETRWLRGYARPLLDDTARVVRIIGAVRDITETRRTRNNQQFINELSAHIRQFAAEPTQIGRIVLSTLGTYLQVARCSLNEIDLDAGYITRQHDWRADGTIRLEGARPLAAELAPVLIDAGRAGQTIIITDATTDSRLSPELVERLQSLDIQGIIAAPCLREDRWVATLTVQQATLRAWRADEVGLVEAVATLAWNAIEKARTEQALRRSEEQLRLITDAVPSLIAYIDREERYQFVNAAYERWFERPRDQIIGHKLSNFVSKATDAHARPYIAAALAGQTVTFEVQTHRRDGKPVIFLFTYTPHIASDGQTQGFYTLVTDITERKQAEDALRVSEARFRGTFEQAAVGLAHVSIDGRFLRVNQRSCEIYGYSSAELLQLTPYAITHPDDLGENLQSNQRLLSGEIATYSMEKRYLRKDGAMIWTNLTVSLQREPTTGAPQYFIAVLEDISTRKAGELALRAAQQQQAELLALLESLLDNAPFGFAFFDRAYRHLRINQTLADLYHLPVAAYLGRTIREVLPSTSEWVIANIDQVFASERGIYNIEVNGLAIIAEGTQRDWMISFYPVKAGGTTMAVGILVVEITELKHQEAELKRLNETLEQRVTERTAELQQRTQELVHRNQELDQFAYVASHYLKAPLRAIEHLAHWISQDAGDSLPAKSQEHLAKLHGRVNRMEKLLDDLLAYSRIGRMEETPEVVDTGALIADILKLLAPPERFTITAPAEMPELTTARVPLELVLRNLINNAIKHHDQPDGRIQIAVRDLGASIEFSITDDGPGIPEQFYERIFQMFQTLKPRDQVEGSGVGLAIVKKTVESRGGTIWVEAAPDRGATFRFTWPKT
ncbi:MAG: PAS domain S-box protein [Chloroflexi bacterium]|nr:PAS domain S-box protein [Chloroflexota bacterium]